MGTRHLTGGEAVVETLRAYGVSHVFGIPGTHTLEIYRALAAAPDIRHITTRHEQGASFMADGYARSSGRPGVCCVIGGPGVTNAATGIATAYADSIPLLCVAAEIPVTDLGRHRGHSHELRSQDSVLAGITDRYCRLEAPSQIPDAVADAFRSFATSRPRPVCLQVPIDVQEVAEPVTIPAAVAHSRPAPEERSIEEAARLLAEAEAPAIVVGGGAAEASDRLVELAARLDAPVVTTLNGRGVIPSGHPLATDATLGYEAAVRFLESCDVVVAVGTELSPADLWTVPLSLSGQLIHIDIDPDQIGVNHPVAVPVAGDADIALRMLLAVQAPLKADGVVRAEAVRRSVRDEAMVMGEPYLPWVSAIRDALPEESCLSLDVAIIAGFGVFPFYPVSAPRQWMFPTGIAALGYALPAAIGAKLGAPERAAAVLTGDGGLMFTLAELIVAVEQGIPLPVIVWNDRAYGEIRRLMLERGFEPIATDLATPDLQGLAVAFGATAEQVADPKALTVAVGRALEADGPTLIEIPAWS